MNYKKLFKKYGLDIKVTNGFTTEIPDVDIRSALIYCTILHAHNIEFEVIPKYDSNKKAPIAIILNPSLLSIFSTPFKKNLEDEIECCKLLGEELEHIGVPNIKYGKDGINITKTVRYYHNGELAIYRVGNGSKIIKLLNSKYSLSVLTSFVDIITRVANRSVNFFSHESGRESGVFYNIKMEEEFN